MNTFLVRLAFITALFSVFFAVIVCGTVLLKRKPVAAQATITRVPQSEQPPRVTKAPNFLIKSLAVSADQVVYLDTEVTDDSVDATIKLIVTASKRYQDVYLLLNSPGGSVFDGTRLIAFIESSPVRVHTVCAMLCASMAAHIHQSGYTRLIEASGILMFHPASGAVQGQVENMASRIDFIQKTVNALDLRASQRSGIPYADFKAKVAFEFWSGAAEALSNGLADQVVYLRTNDSEHPRGISVNAILAKGNPIFRLDYDRPYLYLESVTNQ